MPLTVAVRLNGPLAERLGPRRRLTLADGATTGDLLRALAEEAGMPLPAVAISVAGQVIGTDAALTDGAEVAVLVPYAGG